MADLRDVMNALAGICATTLYPTGTTDPVSAVNNAVTQVKTGWPVSGELDTALAAGTVTVTLFAFGLSKNTTRFIDGWQPVGTITAGVSGAPGTQQAAREVRRTKRDIQITTWASTPDLRDTTGAALDEALALIDRLAMPDGSIAQMRFSRDSIIDAASKEDAYRRDLFYEIEYGTFQTQTDYLITTIIANVDGGISSPDAPIRTVTIQGATS